MSAGNPDSSGFRGLYLVLYMAEGEEIELDGGVDSLVVTPFRVEETQVLHTGHPLEHRPGREHAVSGRMTMVLGVLAVVFLASRSPAETLDLEIGPLAGAVSSRRRSGRLPLGHHAALRVGTGNDHRSGPLAGRVASATQPDDPGHGAGSGHGRSHGARDHGRIAGPVPGWRPVGIGVWVTGHAGWLHLGYTPDQMSFDPGTGLDPVTVNFDPVDEPALGGGLAAAPHSGRMPGPWPCRPRLHLRSGYGPSAGRRDRVPARPFLELERAPGGDLAQRPWGLG